MSDKNLLVSLPIAFSVNDYILNFEIIDFKSDINEDMDNLYVFELFPDNQIHMTVNVLKDIFYFKYYENGLLRHSYTDTIGWIASQDTERQLLRVVEGHTFIMNESDKKVVKID
jgi:hypothetical protein